ncbi:neuropeptide-like 3 [Cephus cinctus]|uniref:Neuropeptide-like 3 n=1 Tax=Cephus cinctus TaxID=211228 RepID=A0AAJ7BPS1_CEPCN|nr:neuropeptide-like 3 [Cephus cinctus]
MFKLYVFLAILAFAMSAPAPAPAPGGLLPAVAAYSEPLVTATSSQYIARNYNTLAAAPLAYAAAPIAYSPYAVAPAYSAYAAAPVFL